MNTAIDAEETAVDMLQALEHVTFDTILGAVILLLLGLVVIRILMRMLKTVVERLPLEKAVTGFLLSAMRIVMIVVLSTMVADKLGIPITSLVALISLFALAISLSVQDVLANVVSGIVILIAKPFTMSDYIETQSASGTVESIGLMYTNLLSPDNKVLMVPNRELSDGRITNYSAKSVRRVDASVRVGYEYDSHHVIAALYRAAEKAGKGHEAGVEPFAAVNGYQEGGIEYVVRVHVPTPDYWEVYHGLLLDIRDELEKDGVVLTYATTRIEQKAN